MFDLKIFVMAMQRFICQLFEFCHQSKPINSNEYQAFKEEKFEWSASDSEVRFVNADDFCMICQRFFVVIPGFFWRVTGKLVVLPVCPL